MFFYVFYSQISVFNIYAVSRRGETNPQAAGRTLSTPVSMVSFNNNIFDDADDKTNPPTTSRESTGVHPPDPYNAFHEGSSAVAVGKIDGGNDDDFEPLIT